MEKVIKKIFTMTAAAAISLTGYSQPCAQMAKLGIGSVTKVNGTQVDVEICLYPQQANTNQELGVGGYVDVLVPAGMGTTATMTTNNSSGSVYGIDPVNSNSTHVAVRLEDDGPFTTWNPALGSKNVQFVLRLTIPAGQCNGSPLEVQTTYDRYGTLGIPEVIDNTGLCSLTWGLTPNSGPVDICPMLALPVKLTTFNAVAKPNCENWIEWKSASEQEFKKYDVEHSSNGTNFTIIAERTGAGDNSEYSFNHAAPAGNAYYRLKMVDIDGGVEYSNVLLVRSNCDGKMPVVLYPNPAMSGSTLGNLGAGEKRITLFDATGKLLLKNTTTNSQYLIDLTRYARGMYMVKLSREGEADQVFRLVKQ